MLLPKMSICCYLIDDNLMMTNIETNLFYNYENIFYGSLVTNLTFRKLNTTSKYPLCHIPLGYFFTTFLVRSLRDNHKTLLLQISNIKTRKLLYTFVNFPSQISCNNFASRFLQLLAIFFLNK